MLQDQGEWGRAQVGAAVYAAPGCTEVEAACWAAAPLAGGVGIPIGEGPDPNGDMAPRNWALSGPPVHRLPGARQMKLRPSKWNWKPSISAWRHWRTLSHKFEPSRRPSLLGGGTQDPHGCTLRLAAFYHTERSRWDYHGGRAEAFLTCGLSSLSRCPYGITLTAKKGDIIVSWKNLRLMRNRQMEEAQIFHPIP